MAPATANGVLPVPAAALQKNPNGASRASSSKSAAPRLKVVVRRLAPALTQVEFETALGDDWKLGGGKVDWFVYKAGKVSKDLAKPSRPSRAYLRLTDQSLLASLADKVRQTSFTDAKNTSRDSALIGPPSLEFAPYPRIPGGRRRNDARQGTIDQDPEFKDFLESLTNPVPKPTPTDVTVDAANKEKPEIKTTPLIEHLREKKLAKEKPQPVKLQTKQHSRGESKDDKASAKASEKKGGRNAAKDTTASPDKPTKQSKAEAKKAKEAAAKEAVKILNKEAASKQSQTTDNNKSTPSGPAAERKRERGNVNIAKQMLQRDLGIGPAAGGRRGRREAAAAAAAAASQETTKPTETASPKEPANPSPAPTPAKPAQSEARSAKKDSRPTRAERRAAGKAKAEAAAATEGNKPAAAPVPPTGPKILKKPQAPAQPAQQPAQQSEKPASTTTAPPAAKPAPAASRAQQSARQPASPVPAPTSKQAFLKHANASQGITEPLIEAALGVFGSIEKVEIDKRKGFAYVDFAEPSGLQKAIAASPVKVAEGAVQVLERKDKAPAQRTPRGPSVSGPPAQAMRGGGAFRGGRGRAARGASTSSTGNASPAAPSGSPAPAAAAQAPASAPAPAAEAPS
ncbi:uncharacterized protein K452DRAFT_324482 [Aplosporella prunicola CBS 121167]|uniref:RRM domain-containing protein n=1 Tax=Aplosporella prunicola CBS 121167 TaxID=1176127 RepID=A0A6A6BPA2_9PEZI|nr:uncharacterized protein K452DRAFT_324482 [Aplosporella prunicola CBS 121167]KAF2145518.1 hypothetical protein K452DRAFT_324482 [Aplosporella prunicola CBS 121167]